MDPTAAVGPLDPASFADDVAVLAGADCDAAAVPLAEALLEAWAEPHRRYHTAEHLAACLAAATQSCGRVGLGDRDTALVRVALWFHDAVYDPRRSDNEERSADLAVSSLQYCDLDDDTAAELHRLVMVTAGHHYDPEDLTAAVVVDADLAVLADPADTYGSYVAQVRGEYAHVSDDAWAEGRAHVLEVLRDALDGVFCTEGDPEGSRSAARANLTAELDALR